MMHSFAVINIDYYMAQVPEMNSSWMESFVRKYNQVDINVFMGSGENVHAPLLRDVVSKGLGSIAAELAENALKLPASEIQPGTFAVHNLGQHNSLPHPFYSGRSRSLLH